MKPSKINKIGKLIVELFFKGKLLQPVTKIEKMELSVEAKEGMKKILKEKIVVPKRIIEHNEKQRRY